MPAPSYPGSETTPYVDSDNPTDGLVADTSIIDKTLGQEKYDFNSRIFPSNLGSDYLGHWMVININVQNQSQFGAVKSTNGGAGFSNPNSLNFNLAGGNEVSKTDALRFGIDGYYTGKNGSMQAPLLNMLGLEVPVVNRTRFTKRIKESIALYMPNSELTFSDAHDFDNISLTKFGAAAGGALAKFLLGGTVAAVGGVPQGVEAGSMAGAIYDQTGSFIGNTAQIMGSPINPKVEVLFTNTFQREFTFDFIFSPTTEKESQDIENIIRTIRFHAAPETQSGFGITNGLPDISTFFWIPPSEFDITFYYKDESGNAKENTKIPRINTCVLKQIDVSYSPTGSYSTFRNGHPVQIRMQLRFIETEVVHKLRVMQGF